MFLVRLDLRGNPYSQQFQYKGNVLVEPVSPQGSVEHSLNTTERDKGS